tara:strand:- start:92 stop:1018 length:927 start_codon:yes stop_codon:yes gene_type:complete
MNNFLITGCAGFIGSHVSDVFVENNMNVVGVDKLTYAGKIKNISKGLKFYNEDICNTDSILKICDEENIDCIVNFAAESHVDNSIKGHDSFIHSNIQGVKSLIDICKQKDILLFQISTDEIYGPIKEGSFHEYAPANPQNYYSATKASAEHLILAYNNTFDFPFKMVRMSNNYGPRQHSEKFLPTILRSLEHKNKIPLYGTGENVRDWIYVRDSARIIYNIAKSSPINEIYNVSFRDERTNKEVITQVLRKMNLEWDECVEFVPDRLGHDFRYSITNDKMMKYVDFKQTSFTAGISKTINWFLQNGGE